MNTHAPRPTRYLNSRRNSAPEAALEDRAGWPAAAAVFALGLGLMWQFPLSRLVMFPYDLLAVKDAQQHWHHCFTQGQAIEWDFAQWAVATLIFATLARKERATLLMPLTLAGFTLVTIAMHATVRLLGLDLYRDLWH